MPGQDTKTILVQGVGNFQVPADYTDEQVGQHIQKLRASNPDIFSPNPVHANAAGLSPEMGAVPMGFNPSSPQATVPKPQGAIPPAAKGFLGSEMQGLQESPNAIMGAMAPKTGLNEDLPNKQYGYKFNKDTKQIEYHYPPGQEQYSPDHPDVSKDAKGNFYYRGNLTPIAAGYPVPVPGMGAVPAGLTRLFAATGPEYLGVDGALHATGPSLARQGVQSGLQWLAAQPTLAKMGAGMAVEEGGRWLLNKLGGK